VLDDDLQVTAVMAGGDWCDENFPANGQIDLDNSP
jgi:hypothetical protein